MSSGRGTLPARLQMAADIAESRVRALVKHCDEMTASGNVGPFGGDALRRKDYLVLLATDKNFQAQVLAKWPYATPHEKQQLTKDLQEALALYPPTGMQPPSVTATEHLLPFPSSEARGPVVA